MARVSLTGMAIRAVVGCVPEKEVSNENDYPWFEPAEIRKVTAMAGIKSRRVADEKTCTSDLCRAAATRLMQQLDWDPRTVDGLSGDLASRFEIRYEYRRYFWRDIAFDGFDIALGAQGRDVLRLILAQGLRPVAIGSAVGLITALALSRLLSSLVYGVTTTDPATFAIAVILLLFAALLASYLPARRAMRVDPMAALNRE